MKPGFSKRASLWRPATYRGADKALASIGADQLSTEQHATYILATARRAELARDYADAATKLEAAATAAAAAHSGALIMNIQLERVQLALAQGNSALAVKQFMTLRKQTTKSAKYRCAWRGWNSNWP